MTFIMISLGSLNGYSQSNLIEQTFAPSSAGSKIQYCLIQTSVDGVRPEVRGKFQVIGCYKSSIRNAK
jgi:hypothetical protein